MTQKRSETMQRHFATSEKMLSAFETEGLLKQTKVTQFVIFARIASPIKFSRPPNSKRSIRNDRNPLAHCQWHHKDNRPPNLYSLGLKKLDAALVHHKFHYLKL